MQSASIAAAEARARRAAKRVGLAAIKRRWRRGSVDNLGGFTLLDPYRNAIIAGERCDLSAAEVIRLCESYE